MPTCFDSRIWCDFSIEPQTDHSLWADCSYAPAKAALCGPITRHTRCNRCPHCAEALSPCARVPFSTVPLAAHLYLHWCFARMRLSSCRTLVVNRPAENRSRSVNRVERIAKPKKPFRKVFDSLSSCCCEVGHAWVRLWQHRRLEAKRLTCIKVEQKKSKKNNKDTRASKQGEKK